jgi:transmembrane sensor
MVRDSEWDLILRYLDGNLSKNDSIILEAWLNASTDNRDQFEQILSFWNVSAVTLPQPEMEQAWNNIEQKAGLKYEIPGIIQLFKNEKYKKATKSGRPLSFILRAAAVLLLAILIPFLSVKISTSPDTNSFQVPEGQVKQITLNDGTRITLDAGSILKYPNEFTGDIREVFLNGEGLFEVTPDPNKPFIVHANEALITVLGTTFNVRAWSSSDKTTVAVAEGKVVLACDRRSTQQGGVIISKNQISILPEKGDPTPPRKTDIKRYLSWQQREMYFQSAPLNEVLDQLQRWYGLQFQLPDSTTGEQRVTVFLENKPIEEILEVLALINNFKYKRDGKEIRFSRKEQS